MPPATLIAGSIPNASSSSTPFFVVPAQPPASRAHQPRNVTFAVPAAPKPAHSQPEIPVVLDTANLFSYKAPAHKHAHHLHSIPPREKTAKTLILDHMLWQHTRARFLQAKSELGLATSSSDARLGARVDPSGVDATGPPDAARSPPELLEDDIRALKYGVRGIDRIKAYFEDTADERVSPLVDLDTARIQRATADGMEKVVASLLSQSIASYNLTDGSHTHGDSNKVCLCQGVRLRIYLSALVNDFFARDHTVTHICDGQDDEEGSSGSESDETDNDSLATPMARRSSSASESRMSISSLVDAAPSPSVASSSAGSSYPLRQSDGPSPSLSRSASFASNSAAAKGKGSTAPVGPVDPPLPRILERLLPLSSYQPTPAPAHPMHHHASSASLPGADGSRRSQAPPNSIFSQVPRGAGPDSPWALGPGMGMGWSARVPAHGPDGEPVSQAPRVWKAIGRSRELFNGGVGKTQSGAKAKWGDEQAAASRATEAAVGTSACPRHLRGTDECPPSCVHATAAAFALGPGQQRHPRATTIGAGLNDAGFPLRRSVKTKPRKKQFAHQYGESRMAEILPRFLRFSALIAKELGREARETGEQRVVDAPSISPIDTHHRQRSHSGRPSAKDREREKETTPSASGNARPSHAWYALLCGIVTRAVLEGYIRGQWKGADPLEVLFGLGMPVTKDAQSQSMPPPRTFAWDGPKDKEQDVIMRDPEEYDELSDAGSESSATSSSTSDWMESSSSSSSDEEEEDLDGSRFEPDGLPSLEEAISILFERGVFSPPRALPTPSAFPSPTTATGMTSSGSTPASPTSYFSTQQPSPTTALASSSWTSAAAAAARIGKSPSVQSTPSPPTGARPGVFNAPHGHAHGVFSAPLGSSSGGRGGSSAKRSSGSNMVRPGVGGGDPDWEWETSERISEFATISLNSPDLLTHLHELSRRYPPEPVERAALRFFESVSEWRGTPELESYKARRAAAAAPAPAPVAVKREETPVPIPEEASVTVKVEEDEDQHETAEAGTPTPSMSPDADDESSPEPSTPTPTGPPKPPIFGYFTVPREMHRPAPPRSVSLSRSASIASTSGYTSSGYTSSGYTSSGIAGLSGGRKRGAEDDDGHRNAKNARSGTTVFPDHVEPGWTGPYGVPYPLHPYSS